MGPPKMNKTSSTKIRLCENNQPSLKHFRFSKDRKSLGSIILHNLLNTRFRIIEPNRRSTSNKVGLCFDHPIHGLRGIPYLVFGIRSPAPRNFELHHALCSHGTLLDAKSHEAHQQENSKHGLPSHLVPSYVDRISIIYTQIRGCP